MNYLEIESVIGREILDSRGNPTVEELFLSPLLLKLRREIMEWQVSG